MNVHGAQRNQRFSRSAFSCHFGAARQFPSLYQTHDCQCLGGKGLSQKGSKEKGRIILNLMQSRERGEDALAQLNRMGTHICCDVSNVVTPHENTSVDGIYR
jgi:hypothetical protein